MRHPLLLTTMVVTGVMTTAAAAPSAPARAGPSTGAGAVAVAYPDPVRVSVSSSGDQGTGVSWAPAISADGRFVAFVSASDTLVPGDTNDTADIFVRDSRTGTTTRVNLSSSGEQAGDYSTQPVISADGRYVAFGSIATNLAPGVTGGDWEIYLRDRWAGTTRQVSLTSSGEQTGGGLALAGGISADGRYVSFMSYNDRLVPGDTNQAPDIFVRDTRRGVTERVSVSSGETQAAGGADESAISSDGRYVSFISDSPDLVANDTNDGRDVFLRDRRNGTTTRVNLTTTGGQADGVDSGTGHTTQSLSGDGRYVAFSSRSTNLVPDDTNAEVDVFVRDTRLGTTTRMTELPAAYPSISIDGRSVALLSNGFVQVRDRLSGVLTTVAPASTSMTNSPGISAGGRHVAFISDEALVPADTNELADIYRAARS
jgi:Tol biopolymer transport system component